MPRLFDCNSSDFPSTMYPGQAESVHFPTMSAPQRQTFLGEYYGSSEPTVIRRQPMNLSQSTMIQRKIFGSVCGRLCFLNDTKKYDISIGEISRRIQAPESLNSSIINGILRVGKKKENIEQLRNDLAKFGLNLELGKRKNYRSNSFTTLCEGEARDMAEDFTDMCLEHGGADHFGKAYVEGLLQEGENSEEILKGIIAMKKFLSFLNKIHNPEATPDQLRNTTQVEHAVNQLSLRTHGFSHVAVSGVAEYMSQMLGSATKTLWRRENGSGTIGSAPLTVPHSFPISRLQHASIGNLPFQSDSQQVAQSPGPTAVSPNLLPRHIPQTCPVQTPVTTTAISRLPSGSVPTEKPTMKSYNMPYSNSSLPRNFKQSEVSSLQDTPKIQSRPVHPVIVPSMPPPKQSIGYFSTPLTSSSQSRIYPRTASGSYTPDFAPKRSSVPETENTPTSNSQGHPQKTFSSIPAGRHLTPEPLETNPSLRTSSVPNSSASRSIHSMVSRFISKPVTNLYTTEDFLSGLKTPTSAPVSSTTNSSTAKENDTSIETYSIKRVKQELVFKQEDLYDEDTRDSGYADMDSIFDDENKANRLLQTDFSNF